MYFKQFYLGCLAHGSYLVGAGGQAAVIDPQRDVDQYIEEARIAGLEIRYIIETHLHADFVSGHIELAKKTGAEIVFGSKAMAAFPHRAVKDGDILKIGTVKLTIMETPGHTPEGICILATDGATNEPAKLFSGDTLFIGDVGRPDLVAARGHSKQEMAAMLYHSLHDKLLKLPDDVEVYPAHGAGSLCGKHLSSEKSSTIGQQRKFNYALKPMSEKAFIEMLTEDLPEVPAYFPKDVDLNRQGAAPLESLCRPRGMTAKKVQKEMQAGVTILDMRNAAEFAAGHIHGSVNIGLAGQFASWAGTLLTMGEPIILITDDDQTLEEAIIRLARVGIESVVGYLENGIQGWLANDLPLAISTVTTVESLARELKAGKSLPVLDVRRPGEYADGHVPGAINLPLAELPQRIKDRSIGLKQNQDLAIICASGYRSSIAFSLLERAGFTNLINVSGGTAAWKKAGCELEHRERAKTL
ncbi:MAG: MBL fold metallo-hydrolase [Cyanobacteria bacterium SZAS LIN-3]|nr:MBL fold metallo-hydrolase [Cyanobacteria bacterium SZAS LIN-3]